MTKDEVFDFLGGRIRIDGECWLWNRSYSTPYPKIFHGGKSQNAHRVINELVNGSTTVEKPVVRHLCNRKNCINPDHLRSGTQKENVHDSLPFSQRKGHLKKIFKPRDVDFGNLVSWLRTVVRITDGCWEYPGSNVSGGYSQISIRGKTWRLSRLVWCLVNDGEYEDKTFVVRHSCHNKKCVNPDHLINGTRQQNAYDSICDSAKSKLNWLDIEEIRKDLANYQGSNFSFDKKWAEKKALHYTTIQNIRLRKSWKNIGIER